MKPNEGYEVKLTDEERRNYYVYRRDRDIIHGKPGTEPARPKTADKDKKPFEDRVLQKALDYLREEVKKAGANRAATESGGA